MLRPHLVTGALLLVVFGAGPANADILYDNLSNASSGAYPGNFERAASFSTDANIYSLTTVILDLGQAIAGGDFVVALDSSSIGSNPVPDGDIAVLGTFADSSLSASPSDYVVNVSPEILLTPDTRYWIVVRGTSSDDFDWAAAKDASGTGVSGEYWATFSDGAWTSDANSSALPPPVMQVDADLVAPVPEPSAMPVLMAALAGWAAFRLRSRVFGR